MTECLLNPPSSFRFRQTAVVVERVNPLPNLRPGENIYDYSKYKCSDFQYRIIRDTDTEKWGNIDVILTEYVEGERPLLKDRRCLSALEHRL